jgi:hypothetical protein
VSGYAPVWGCVEGVGAKKIDTRVMPMHTHTHSRDLEALVGLGAPSSSERGGASPFRGRRGWAARLPLRCSTSKHMPQRRISHTSQAHTGALVSHSSQASQVLVERHMGSSGSSPPPVDDFMGEEGAEEPPSHMASPPSIPTAPGQTELKPRGRRVLCPDDPRPGPMLKLVRLDTRTLGTWGGCGVRVGRCRAAAQAPGIPSPRPTYNTAQVANGRPAAQRRWRLVRRLHVPAYRVV